MWCTARNLLVQDRILSSSNITAYKLLKNYTRGRYQYAVFVLNVLINYEYKTAHDPRMGCYWLQLSVKPPPYRRITPRNHQKNLILTSSTVPYDEQPRRPAARTRS